MKSPTCDRYALRQADRALILAQRLLETITHLPEIEEDMALANLALDLIGQARALYTYVDGEEGGEDRLAYFRRADEFLNPLLVEQPNGDFAGVIVRQFLHDAFAVAYWRAMVDSTDATFAALAGKAVKETTYHLRHSRSWVIRLGDGTDESHRRIDDALARLWPFTHELFDIDDVERALIADGVAADPAVLYPTWLSTVSSTLDEATIDMPAHHGSPAVARAPGGRTGQHSPAFAALIDEMQIVARAHPGAAW